MKKFFSIFFCLPLFWSCVKDKPQNAIQPALQLSSSKKVYVVNEGGFGYNQASVSLYDPATGQVIEDLYKTQNNAALGDVAQSLSQINNSYYIVVNNSNKIVVCDQQFKKTALIGNLASPRYILPVTNQKAYVSDLSANAISIIDLNSNTKTGSIPCSGWTEQMALIYNKAYVTNLRTKYIYSINTLTDVKADSVDVGINAGSLVIDKFDKLWVLSTGDQLNAIPGRLVKINTANNQVELSLAFAASGSPDHLRINKTKDTLYYLNGGIFRLPVSGNALPGAPFVAAGSKNFYGLGINSNNNTIYAADALDYAQRSNIYIYDAQGGQRAVFKAGIISNGFYFE